MTPLHRRLAVPVAVASLLIASAAVAVGDGRHAAKTSGTIAYTVSGGDRGHLWLMDVDSGTKRQLTRSSHREEGPSWSPDGRRIAYAHTRKVRVPGFAARQIVPRIAIIDVRTHRVRVLTGGASFEEEPAWSPDGRRIAMTRTAFRADGSCACSGSEIWVMRRGGGGARRLTHNRVGDFAPAWSPNGRLLAFTRYRGRETDARGIWVMRPGGKGERRLIRNGTRPSWSPDGRRIAYGHVTRRTAGNCGCRVTNLMVADAQGGSRRVLVRNGGRPTWSPDGRRIVFERRDRRGSVHLWVVRQDGSGLRRLSAGRADQYAAAWRPPR